MYILIPGSPLIFIRAEEPCTSRGVNNYYVKEVLIQAPFLPPTSSCRGLGGSLRSGRWRETCSLIRAQTGSPWKLFRTSLTSFPSLLRNVRPTKRNVIHLFVSRFKDNRPQSISSLIWGVSGSIRSPPPWKAVNYY